MFNRTMFKKRILFVGIPDMAYIGLDGLLMAGVNIVGVLGPKKDHNMYYDFKNFVYSCRNRVEIRLHLQARCGIIINATGWVLSIFKFHI